MKKGYKSCNPMKNLERVKKGRGGGEEETLEVEEVGEDSERRIGYRTEGSMRLIEHDKN